MITEDILGIRPAVLRWSALPACALGLLLLPAARGVENPRPAKPNIVIILADDLGYMDVAAYAARLKGGDRAACYYETPNLDRLVDQGVAFSQAYVYQLCSPSRAAILTGRDPSRIGVTTAWFEGIPNAYNRREVPPPGHLALDAVHFDPIKTPQPWRNGLVLQGLPACGPMDQGRNEVCLPEVLTGYDSAFLGKWHLGGAGVVGYQPADQGFQHVLAFLDGGASTHFDWRSKWTPDVWAGWPGWAAIRDEPRVHGFYPHPEPSQPYLTDALTDLAVDFIREHPQRSEKPFLLFFSHYAVHTPIQARPEDVAHFQAKATRGWNGQQDPAYAGLVKALDDSVGRVVDALRQSGQLDNTMIVFLSDNGGLMSVTRNTPLRDGKAFLHEGGIRVPFVVWWPGQLAPAWCDEPVNAATGLLPTLAELTGHPLPVPVDGQSVVPLLRDPANREGTFRSQPIYWNYPYNCELIAPDTGLLLPPASAIRVGDHKLIWNWAGALELYDVAHDISEQRNLAAAKPELALQLFRQLAGWLDHNVEARYLPKRNLDYDPAKDPRRLLHPFRDLRQELLRLTTPPGLPDDAGRNAAQALAAAAEASARPAPTN